MVFGYLLLRLQEGSLRNSIGKYSDPEIPSCLKGPGSFSEGTPLLQLMDSHSPGSEPSD